MHWVVQKGVFSPDNFELLLGALERLGVEFSIVSIRRGKFDLEPDVNPTGRVYACGAVKLAKIARDRGWNPGSFLNDNFRFDVWRERLGKELLNFDAVIGKFSEIEIERFSEFFIRPLADDKSFDGMVIDQETMSEWRRDPDKANLDVVVSSRKTIHREYRIFVVKNDPVTGSLYRVAGNPQLSDWVAPFVIDYVNQIIGHWLPAESCVVDIGISEDGPRVIEFNNINSSGFYACDVPKYVDAIRQGYGSQEGSPE